MRALVLDFDGTVAETREAVSATLNVALAAHGYPRVHPPAIWRLMGLPLEQLVGRVIPPTSSRDGVGAVVATYRVRFDEVGAPAVRRLPGVDGLLDAAAARGVSVGIATSREGSSLTPLLARLALTGRFGALATCERVMRGKPAPDLALLALAELDVGASDALVVGDTTWDVEMALAAGARAVAVTTGDHPADRLAAAGPEAVVPDLAGVLAWLGWTG